MADQNTADKEAWFSGMKVFGDEFSYQEIARWFEEETEGYAELGSKERSKYSYQYHVLNYTYGFRHLKKVKHFEHVLGFGAAWGHEFLPIIHKIGSLTITEPSENLRSKQIGTLKPDYVKPEIDGKLQFGKNQFDLVTCFGTLHHIPNVSFVLCELIRVLKPGGYLLLREPIISLGDWEKPRPGLTKNERGIPLSHFDNIFRNQPVEVIARNHCFTMTYQIQKIAKRILRNPLISYRWYIYIDRLLSSLLKGNVRYHAVKKQHRIAPSNIFFVVRKI